MKNEQPLSSRPDGVQRRAPFWTIGLLVAGNLAGFGRRNAQEPSDRPPGASHRGHSASRPSDIPAPGWKDILVRTYREFGKDRLMLVAAGLTFYVLLAVFPAISAFISIYGLFVDPATVGEHLDAMAGIVPAGGMDILSEQMSRLASQDAATLGFGLIFGLGVALWSANSGMKSFFDALNIVYEENEKRGFIKLTLVSMAFTLSLLVFLAIALGVVIALPIVFDFIGLGALETWLLLLRWPILLIVVALGIAVMFRYGPSREHAKWRWVSW